MSNSKPIREGHLESREAQYRKRLSTRHSLRIILRNAIYAALGRIAIGLLKLAAKRGLGRRFLSDARGEILSLDPLKWAVVLGGFSSFRLCVQTITRLGAIVKLPEKAATLISGCICSLPALVMNKETRTELCLYAMVRAAHTFALRFVFPRLPDTLRNFDHYDVLLMCMSSSQIAYAFLFCPSSIPHTYFRFLLKASMYDADLVRGHSSHLLGHKAPELVTFCDDHNYPLVTGYGQQDAIQLCQYSHPGYSCNMWALSFIPRNMLQLGIPLYAPLRLMAMLHSQRKKFMANPLNTIYRNCRSVLTSSLFLALYITWILRSTCICMQAGVRGGARVALLCFLSGLATLLEPKGRRMDLALYCSMYALRSFILTQNKMGRLPYPKHWFCVGVYLASMSFMFYEYEEEPKLVNNRVRTVFKLLLGEKVPVSKSEDDKRKQVTKVD